uniref:restriction endonuclease n=1 Tax=Rheinheimera sp. TaxID=1869214 RepID=UPI004047F5BE
MNLSAADPQKAFDALKGIAGRVSEVVPITPKVQINRNDKRFVESQDVLRNLSSQDNLASMPWEDFEHLCRQVLEREFASDGAEVKVTQASRDKGVDAIVFDNRSLREGKIVVQAKRYTRTVDVSAVRDLYGTMMNEGAMKGILITTSHFGADSYEFIQGKPLSLVSGAELLGLLQKHGYDFRIDLDEARKLMMES